MEWLVRSLSEQVSKLTALLEEERRRGKRQAAPFSKGPPVEEPKKPGRKSGKRHGRHAHRSVPPRITNSVWRKNQRAPWPSESPPRAKSDVPPIARGVPTPKSC